MINAAIALPASDSFSARVRDILAQLLPLPNLAPQPLVDSLLGELVRLAKGKGVNTLKSLKNLKADGTLLSLHRICAEAEYLMEVFWAEKVALADKPLKMLKQFPYWANYVKLARMEVAALRKVSANVRKVLFVGAGPLPLSAYMMSLRHGLSVHNLDCSCEACAAARQWLDKVPALKGMTFEHCDIADFTGFENYDVVVLAALVGLSGAEKKKLLVVMAAQMNPGQILLVRSVRGLRRLLYPAVDTADLQGFEVVKAVHPRGEVINSALLLRKAA